MQSYTHKNLQTIQFAVKYIHNFDLYSIKITHNVNNNK